MTEMDDDSLRSNASGGVVPIRGNDAHEESLLSMLADLPPVRIRFWTCPVHREQRDEQGYRNAIVEWREGTAHCMVDGCGRTSAPPLPKAPSGASQEEAQP